MGKDEFGVKIVYISCHRILSCTLRNKFDNNNFIVQYSRSDEGTFFGFHLTLSGSIY